MTELVIEAPHLQTLGQRLSTYLILMAGWCLWGYFAWPLVELAGCFLGLPVCSAWVNRSGGFQGLQHLLVVYGATIAALLGIWSFWALYNGRQQKLRRATQVWAETGPRELCRTFGVSLENLAAGVNGKVVTLQFDTSGRIMGLEARAAADRVSATVKKSPAKSLFEELGLTKDLKSKDLGKWAALGNLDDLDEEGFEISADLLSFLNDSLDLLDDAPDEKPLNDPRSSRRNTPKRGKAPKPLSVPG